MHFLRLLAVCWPGAHSARHNHAVACNFAKYSPILFFFIHTLSNKPFLIWLLTIPPHLKYIATQTTLPYNLSLVACFTDINVSQGNVATYATCGGIFNIHLIANVLRNVPVNLFNRLRFGPPCILRTYAVVRGMPFSKKCQMCGIASVGREHLTSSWGKKVCRYN